MIAHTVNSSGKQPAKYTAYQMLNDANRSYQPYMTEEMRGDILLNVRNLVPNQPEKEI